MKPDNLPFTKLVVALFDSGLWARMSAAARTLYPVLLRFSDGKFKPVFPGTALLLKLTGFKQKHSIRDARNELVELGLIAITKGSGQKNTYYHFRFEWAGGSPITQGGSPGYPTEGLEAASPGGTELFSRGAGDGSPHNQIHITITNHLENRLPGELEAMIKKFGEDKVRGAVTELTLAGLPANAANVEGVIQHANHAWTSLREKLTGSLSRESIRLLDQAWMGETNGKLCFRDDLPGHLKKIVTRHGNGVEFVQSAVQTAATR